MNLRKVAIASVLVVGAVIGGVALTGRGTDTTGDNVSLADVPVGTGSMSVSPASADLAVGATTTVRVLISTGKDQTTGTDFILNYDPKILEVVDANASETGVQITPGKSFDFVPDNGVSTLTGTITFSGSQQPTSKAVTGDGLEVATITFKAKAAGTSALSFDYTPGLLSDSNIIKADDGRDLLSRITNGSLTVK